MVEPLNQGFRDLRPWVGRNVVLFFGVALVATYAALASHHLVPRPLDLQQVEKLFDKNEGAEKTPNFYGSCVFLLKRF